LKFRRQHPVAGYVADFFCEDARLAVELDGGGHAEQSQADYDARRTERLERLGIRLLRFWNTDVLLNTEGVLQRILEVAKDREA
jgi:very-short-patch-repair endonuclease